MHTTVNVVIATCARPVQLNAALTALATAADRSSHSVAVTVVDDDPAGSARGVVAEFADAFGGGCDYVVSGARNISAARNRGLEAAVGTCEWVGSIDDDVLVPADWVDTCHAALSGGPFSAVTGSLVKDFSAGPAWLRREPFGQIGITEAVDGGPIHVCATGNNWVSEPFLASRPGLRFDLAFGRTGGEDVEFFQRAVAAGLRPVYCRAASVVEPQPPDRCTLRYQVRRSFWLGALETRVLGSDQRPRIAARAARRLLTLGHYDLEPEQRRQRRVRYCLTAVARALGGLYGVAGRTVGHR